MATTETRHRERPKRPKKRTTKEWHLYIVEITDWDYYCGSSIRQSRHDIGDRPVAEFSWLSFFGTLDYPEKHKIERVEISVRAWESDDPINRPRENEAGGLWASKGVLSISTGLPRIAFSELVSMTAHGQINSATIHAQPKNPKYSRILTMHFSSKLADEN